MSHLSTPVKVDSFLKKKKKKEEINNYWVNKKSTFVTNAERCDITYINFLLLIKINTHIVMLTNIISFNIKTESLANLYTSLAAASTRSHTVRYKYLFVYYYYILYIWMTPSLLDAAVTITLVR